jgi:ABC-type multidrug transport system fused ATPase/permease subunit
MKMTPDRPLTRLLYRVRTCDRALFGVCAGFTLAAALVQALPVALTKLLVGELTGPAPAAETVLVLAGAFFLLDAGLSFLKQWLLETGYPRITALRIDYIRDVSVKLLEMRYPNVESAAFYEENQTAFQAPSSNNNGVEGCLHKLFELPQYALVVLGLLVFLGLRSVPVMLALALRLAVSCFAAARVQKYEYSRREDVSRRTRRIWAYSENARDFAYGKDVRLYDLKERVLEHFRLELRAYLDVQRAIKNREYAFGFLNLAALLLADGATYGILTAQAFRGMPVADFTMYAAAASALTAQMTALTDNLGFLLRERRYVRDFFAFLDRDLGEKTDGRPALPPDVPLSVEFRDVSFRYPGTEQNVLEHFSLTIPAGQKLAVVGVNGAGKTTLVKLLTGLYQPDAGQILLSGVDAGEFAPLERWKMFAAVFQEVNVLALTAAQNVACRLDGIDRARAERALREAGLWEKIAGLPRGMDTMLLRIIDEDGAVLSGGENQKLAIARALYKGGSCIVMDEPTAALDALAEAEIYEKFDALTRGRTALYISHRLASTKFCDKIALLGGTGLLEYGTHEELMAQNGVYRAMFTTQGKYYQEEAG